MITWKRITATAVFVTVLGGVPDLLWAQPPFPTRGMDIIHSLYAGVNPQDDDARRIAVKKVCEQMTADLGPKWGNKKRAGLSDDYRSPDSVAYLEDDGSVSVWDIQASSGAITVHAGKPPDYPKLSPGDAAFMGCEPKNWLGAPVPNPGTNPPSPGTPAQPPVDLSGLATKEDVLRVEAKLDVHEAREAAFREAVASKWKRFGVMLAKYGLPIVGAVIGTWYGKPENE